MLLKRASVFLEEAEWEKADKYAEKVLDINLECAEAYLIKLMAEFHVVEPDAFLKGDFAIDKSKNYMKALRFSRGELKQKITDYGLAYKNLIDDLNKQLTDYDTELYYLGIEIAELRQNKKDYIPPTGSNQAEISKLKSQIGTINQRHEKEKELSALTSSINSCKFFENSRKKSLRYCMTLCQMNYKS